MYARAPDSRLVGLVKIVVKIIDLVGIVVKEKERKRYQSANGSLDIILQPSGSGPRPVLAALHSHATRSHQTVVRRLGRGGVRTGRARSGSGYSAAFLASRRGILGYACTPYDRRDLDRTNCGNSRMGRVRILRGDAIDPDRGPFDFPAGDGKND